jgi:hypothetical protein
MSLRKIDSYKKHIEKRFFFRHLLESSKPSIVALINEKDKKILIHATQSPYQFMGNIAALLSKKQHVNKELRRDRKKLSFKILSQYSTSNEGLVNKLERIDYYKSQGYTIYNTEKLPHYKVHVVMTTEYKLQVRLISAGRRVYPIKEFITQKEADEFVSSHTIFDMLRMRKIHATN